MYMPFASRTFCSDDMERQLISFMISHLLKLPDHQSKSVSLANSIVESFGIVILVLVSHIGYTDMDSQRVQWILESH